MFSSSPGRHHGLKPVSRGHEGGQCWPGLPRCLCSRLVPADTALRREKSPGWRGRCWRAPGSSVLITEEAQRRALSDPGLAPCPQCSDPGPGRHPPQGGPQGQALRQERLGLNPGLRAGARRLCSHGDGVCPSAVPGPRWSLYEGKHTADTLLLTEVWPHRRGSRARNPASPGSHCCGL